jgi:GGDEF domain-containing protein
VLTDLGARSRAVQHSIERIQAALAEPIAFNGTKLGLGAAVGVATYPADAGDASALLAHADRKMYADKGARNGTLR